MRGYYSDIEMKTFFSKTELSQLSSDQTQKTEEPITELEVRGKPGKSQSLDGLSMERKF